ncbi:MAG: hypothetical protein D6704_08540 [Nitrospirae bacterium]|nr:MAG: hypothetical protein D6704_08540 [Nitrospirota bacterium]
MRKPHERVIDRALLVYLLHWAASQNFSLVSDVKLQQLVFLCALQMVGKGWRGFHYDFMRFAYGAFSKELDDDLLALRRKECLENFDVLEKSQPIVSLIDAAIPGTEANEQVMEILRSVIETYGPQDLGEITNSVEKVELSPADKPEQKLLIREISFHSILLVPSRVEVTGEFTVSPATLVRLNALVGV